MRRVITAGGGAALLALALLAAWSAVFAAPPGDPFVGAWEATDIIDGSTLRLSVGGGPGASHRIRLSDDRVTAGGCPFDTPAVVIGVGTVSGNVMTIVNAVVRCLADGSTFLFGDTLTYDSGTDTLIASDGTTFSRVGVP